MTHPIIKTDNYILITSDEEIKEDCYAVHFSPLGEIELVTANGVCKLDKKVIAHLPLNNSPLKGVPLLPPLPDEEDEIIENLENYLLKVNQLYKDWLGIGFKGGYHKAKEKYKFTEEDVRFIILKSFLLGVDMGQYSKELEDRLVSSLSQPKLPVGFKCEMEYYYKSSEEYYGKEARWVNCDKSQYESIKKEILTCPVVSSPKIINGVMQGEWIFE